MTHKRSTSPLAAIAIAVASAFPALAQEQPGERGTWSLTFENDVFGGSDRDYTNGVRVDYVRPRNRLTAFGRFGRDNLDWFTDSGDWYESFAIGQNIYTPEDISDPVPPPASAPTQASCISATASRRTAAISSTRCRSRSAWSGPPLLPNNRRPWSTT